MDLVQSVWLMRRVFIVRSRVIFIPRMRETSPTRSVILKRLINCSLVRVRTHVIDLSRSYYADHSLHYEDVHAWIRLGSCEVVSYTRVSFSVVCQIRPAVAVNKLLDAVFLMRRRPCSSGFVYPGACPTYVRVSIGLWRYAVLTSSMTIISQS